MVLTPSTMMPLGTKAPDFQLSDTISGGFSIDPGPSSFYEEDV